MKKRVLLFVGILLLFLAGCQQKEVKMGDKVDVTAYYHYNNQPVYSIGINTYNYQNVLEKLMTGNFDAEDFTHYSFDIVKRNHTVKGKKVTIDDQYVFGEGIQNSESDAREMIKILFLRDRDYLDYINGLKNLVALSNPDNSRYKFTDTDGKALGQIEEGLTVFQNTATPDDIVLKDVHEGDVIEVGNTRTTQSPITVNGSTDNIDSDYSETITYKIPVQSEQLTIRVSPHFVVDTVSVPYSQTTELVLEKEGKNGVLEKVADSPSVTQGGVKVVENSSGRDKFLVASEELSHLHSIDKLTLDISKVQGKVVTLTGHVTSKRTYSIKTYDSDADETSQELLKELTVINDNQKQGIYVEDEQGYLSTPMIYSYGANFAMYDATKNQVVQGSEYVLGRIEKGKVSLYQGTGKAGTNWQATNQTAEELAKDAQAVDSAYVFTGNSVVYSDRTVDQLQTNPRLWAYDEEQQIKENESLFKIRGLSSEYKYVLIQTKAGTTLERQTTPYYFTVDATSVQKAQFGNYAINGSIIDMKYGEEEYNALGSVEKGKSAHQPMPVWLGVTLFLVAVGGIAAGAITFVVKKG